MLYHIYFLFILYSFILLLFSRHTIMIQFNMFRFLNIEISKQKQITNQIKQNRTRFIIKKLSSQGHLIATHSCASERNRNSLKTRDTIYNSISSILKRSRKTFYDVKEAEPVFCRLSLFICIGLYSPLYIAVLSRFSVLNLVCCSRMQLILSCFSYFNDNSRLYL